MQGGRYAIHRHPAPTSLMILARGSKLRYTRCPNPNSFSFLAFTPAMKAGMFSTWGEGAEGASVSVHNGTRWSSKEG